MSENEIKVSQYADDTTLILDGSKESLMCALQVLENFRQKLFGSGPIKIEATNYALEKI